MTRTLALGTLVLLALALAAFWPMYLSKPFGTIDPYTHAHAALGLAWVLLLVAQPLLIRGGQRGLHRALGRLSWVLAPAFVASSVLLAHHRFSRMAPQVFPAEAFTLYLPFAAALLFGVAYALALATRRDAPVHARFMACTALPLIDPVLGRILAFHLPPWPRMELYQGVTFGVELLLALVLLRPLQPEHPSRKLFRAYVLGQAVVLGAWFIVPRTGAWLACADWFRSLPLT